MKPLSLALDISSGKTRPVITKIVDWDVKNQIKQTIIKSEFVFFKITGTLLSNPYLAITKKIMHRLDSQTPRPKRIW